VSTPRRRPRWGLIAALAPLVIVGLLLAAWGIDTATGGDVVRNVELAGRPVGGDERTELDGTIAAYTDQLATTPVRLVTPNGELTTTAAELGVSVDADATRQAVLDAGRGFAPARPLQWLASMVSPHEVDPVVDVDAATVSATVIALEGENRVLPTEPTFQLGDDGALDLVAGVPGTGLDPADVAAALPDAIVARDDDSQPIVVEVEQEPIAPQMDDDAVQTVIDDLNAVTSVPMTVVVNGHTADIDPASVRSWLRPTLDPMTDEPTYAVDQESALASLRAALPEVGSGSVDARFDLVGGQVVLSPSQDGTGCCADDTAARILQSLQQGAHSVTLELGTDPADLTTETAQSWGITQPIGGNRAWPESRAAGAAPGFTTFHAAGEARVTNIHRIADIVRGAVIPPGGQFSVNGHVGRRTTENGFVAAGAIRNGEHVSEVGGGVSQFATTLFNAAYFAGLDITTYQAHSEYFDRYPRGREATMGFPDPDLVIENTTPYGVMIWTSYTASSLTVTMYSTPFASGEQTGIDEGTSGNCRVVTTTRTRTYVDGRPPVQDTFRATYRPGAGQFC
jgi:vancomycin resistance protein YoaR